MVGPLPEDFLRVGSSPEQQQIAADEQTAQMLQAQQAGQNCMPFAAPNMARLTVTLSQVNSISCVLSFWKGRLALIFIVF